MRGKRHFLMAVVIAVIAVVSGCGGGGGGSSAGGNADVGGYWNASFTYEGLSTTDQVYLLFTQSGGSITMTDPCSVGHTLTGTVSGNNLSIAAAGTPVNFAAAISGSTMSGTFTDDIGSGSWTAIKMSDVPSNKACVVASVDVWVAHFLSNDQYWATGTFYDLNAVVSSATITGTGMIASVPFTYELYHPKQWWSNSDSNLMISTTTPPSFPRSYSVTVNFKDGTSELVSRTSSTVADIVP